VVVVAAAAAAVVVVVVVVVRVRVTRRPEDLYTSIEVGTSRYELFRTPFSKDLSKLDFNSLLPHYRLVM
jgi:hypothetical protein